MAEKGRRWPGGRIHRQKDGRDLFIIEKKVRGQRFHISTRCHAWKQAMEQLARFEANPLAYAPEGDEPAEAMAMTADLVSDFEAWRINIKGVTKKHAREGTRLLADWIEDLNGADLRKLELKNLKAALDRRAGSRPHRIIVIKAFFTWMRREKGLVTTAQDATLEIPVPQARPEKHRRRKAVPIEHVRAALEKLPEKHRDCLYLLARTGWHVSELERFARSEEARIVEAKRGDTIATLVVRHKSGRLSRTPVAEPELLAVAKRIRGEGGVPRRLNATIKKACEAAEVPAFTAGVMRHSLGTWAVESGTDPRDVSRFLGHLDPRTLSRFYEDVEIPTVNVRLPKL